MHSKESAGSSMWFGEKKFKPISLDCNQKMSGRKNFRNLYHYHSSKHFIELNNYPALVGRGQHLVEHDRFSEIRFYLKPDRITGLRP